MIVLTTPSWWFGRRRGRKRETSTSPPSP